MAHEYACLLLTGASGLVGAELAERFLGRRAALCALVHQRPPPCAGRRAVEVYAGDIARPRLGLAPDQYGALAARVTAILHCAGRTEFSLSPSVSARANVAGTKNLIAFARACPRLEKIGVLSTVYVAGRRRGQILEKDLGHRAGFVNTYEASKHRMELFLREEQARLPIAIYRLSTILGDARTGRVTRFNALHQALRLYYHGLVPMVPGEENSPVDLISSDYAADAVFHLFDRAFQPGATYHVVAGRQNMLGLGELLEWTAALFARFDRRWNSRGVAVPPIVPLETFRMLEASVRKTGNRILERLVGLVGSFAPQLSYPKQFDDRNARRGLKGAGIQPPALREFYPRIVRYCLAAGWGARTRHKNEGNRIAAVSDHLFVG